MSQFTHINASGEANMVDVSAKQETVREARAEAWVSMSKETLDLIVSGSHHKGDVFATARIAGIQAAKNLGLNSAVSSIIAFESRSAARSKAGNQSSAY